MERETKGYSEAGARRNNDKRLETIIMQKYTGGCHCRAVQYEVEADLTKTFVCNCSHCEMKGFILAFVPDTSFTLLSEEDMLSEYRFNTKKIAHLFCKVCGVQSFGRGTDQQGNATVAINVRSLEGVDLETLHPEKFDGLSL